MANSSSPSPFRGFGNGQNQQSSPFGSASRNSTTSSPVAGRPSSTANTPSFPATSTSNAAAASADLPVEETEESVPKPGTGGVSIVLFVETDSAVKGEIEVISAQPECSNYSLEEHRLADYNKGLGVRSLDQIAQNTMWRLAPPFNKALLTDRRSREHLKLLRGAAIEVCVGEGPCKCSSPETCDCNESWVLPKALISRYSSFLKSACTRDFKERNENRIELPEDDPKVFALFVEWMYYGSYTILAPSILSDNTYDDINMNARCWILGDKLLSTEFKNLAMGRLYTQCMATMFTIGTVTPHDVQYACENSAAGSKLRQFYFSYVVEHFATPMKLKGSTEEWDEVMLHHADLRSVLIKSFRVAPEDRLKVESEKAYMDHDELLTSAFDRLRLEGNSS